MSYKSFKKKKLKKNSSEPFFYREERSKEKWACGHETVESSNRWHIKCQTCAEEKFKEVYAKEIAEKDSYLELIDRYHHESWLKGIINSRWYTLICLAYPRRQSRIFQQVLNMNSTLPIKGGETLRMSRYTMNPTPLLPALLENKNEMDQY